MKTLLLIPCLFGALIMASAAPSLAANNHRAGEVEISQAEACQASCRANAESCRTQCSDSEEQEQCVVGCDKAACKANCATFEDTCKQRCQQSGG
jgi:hypothetical protein